MTANGVQLTRCTPSQLFPKVWDGTIGSGRTNGLTRGNRMFAELCVQTLSHFAYGQKPSLVVITEPFILPNLVFDKPPGTIFTISSPPTEQTVPALHYALDHLKVKTVLFLSSPLNNGVEEWKEHVRKKGVTKIEGSYQGDGSVELSYSRRMGEEKRALVESLLEENRTFKERVYPLLNSTAERKSRTLVVTCSDSRVVPEMVFLDPSLITVRNAGNIVDKETAEYISGLIEKFKVSDVVVLGHTDCGAIKASMSKGRVSEKLRSLISFIQEGIRNGDNAVEENLKENITNLFVMSEVISNKRVNVWGGIYDLPTCAVRWIY